MQTICLTLLQLLFPLSVPDSTSQKIIEILKSLQSDSSSFLHLVLPDLSRLLTNSQSCENVGFLKSILNYVQSLVTDENTLQYASLIVHGVIKCMADREDVAKECRECLIEILVSFKGSALVYLPGIVKVFNQCGFRNDPQLKIVVEYLKEYGDLEGVENALESQLQQRSPAKQLMTWSDNSGWAGTSNPLGFNQTATRDKEKDAKTAIDLDDLVRSFNSEYVKNLFDVSNNSLKEDWEEWLTKTSSELILSSPSKVLFCCKSFANVNPNICKELFNIAFAMVWALLNENQRSSIIQNIEKTISLKAGNQNVPLSVLKAILNLAEFMEHDNQGLQLDIPSMASLAEKCNAQAKALYYREYQFNFSPDESIESLISLYSSLGQPEAAKGMLEYAKNVLGTKVKDTWLESLGEWHEALKEYSKLEPENKVQRFSNLKDQIRCYDALTEWDKVITLTEELVEEHVDYGDIAQYAAKASIQLGKWDLLEKYSDKIDTRKDDSNYYKAMINIAKKDYPSATFSIRKSRKYLENFILGLNQQTYHNNYDKLLRLQALSEMEEIIHYMEFIEDVDNGHSQNPDRAINRARNSNSKKLIEKKKSDLLEMWGDRLEAAEKNLYTWLEIIPVRTLLFKKCEMLPMMTKLSRLALTREDEIGDSVCQRIFQELELQLNEACETKKLLHYHPPADFEEPKLRPTVSYQPATTPHHSRFVNFNFKKPTEEEYQFPPEFYLFKFEKMYRLKELNDEAIYDAVMEFFKSVDVDPRLRAIYCRRLGSWLTTGLKEGSQRGFDKVLGLFKDSIKHDDSDVKTWHLYALTNYKRLLQVTATLEKNSQTKGDQTPSAALPERVLSLITESFKGFVKSISLGGPDFTETLQDTLKLLELWFKYGSQKGVPNLLNESLDKIDITCWLNVLPQTITKLDCNNEEILSHTMKLLEYVGYLSPRSARSTLKV